MVKQKLFSQMSSFKNKKVVEMFKNQDKDSTNVYFSVQLKPVGNACNLRCNYCYAKSHLATGKIMSDEILEATIKKIIKQNYRYPTFSWHGGEPTLIGYEFFEFAVQLMEKYRRHKQTVYNLIQTNATRINPELAELFSENNFGVSISLDGSENIHGKNRKFINGTNSFTEVIKGVENLQEYNIEPLVICTVSKDNLPYVTETFDFLISQGFRKIKYSPVFDSLTDNFSITSDEWFEYLKKVFYRWFEIGDPEIQVRELDEVIVWLSNTSLNLCSSNKTCLNWISINPDGEIYPCEYLKEQYRYGNIIEVELNTIISSPQFLEFRRVFANNPTECQKCEFLKLCGNGCPTTRIKNNQISSDGVYAFCGQRKKLFYEIKKTFDKELN
ncbi:MAG TPA: hypothetical protein DHV62_07875 [Elusimicrobia bacterium]|nr:hypothetical protein [Elusimicrobiota bacterium]